jgi:hypothetical protein
MTRLRLVIVTAALISALPASRTLAQSTGTAAASSAPDAMTPSGPEVLPGFPRPPDAPKSLLEEPSSPKAYSCAPLPGRYFERDAVLDPPDLPQPGWFTDLEIGIVVPHLKNHLVDNVQIDGAAPVTVHVATADLDWTVAPRIEAGYRLPSGFGDFAVAYRFFGSDGTGAGPGFDSTAALKTRVCVNVVDMDYTSREFATFQWPYCVDMRWRFGLRWSDAYFDSRADEPFAATAVGSTIYETRISNNFWGLGPHLGLELTRHFQDSGLSFLVQADGATLLGRIRQNFFAASTTAGPGGVLLTGNTRESISQDVPIMSAFMGISWQPPGYTYFRFDAGYEFEYWWNVGRNSDTRSRGELGDQGIVLRAAFNF